MAASTELDAALGALEQVAGAPVLFYAGTVTSDTLPILYEHLQSSVRWERLHLVLISAGGGISAARQLALLLRNYVAHLTIAVPRQARSAATLLCLAADELALGPLAELGPIDPRISGSGGSARDEPGLIAAEEVRAFVAMSREWFGVDERDALQVLALVAQRIFPTSLSRLYRADRHVRQVADELLTLGLPSVSARQRAHIIAELVENIYDHEHAFTPSDIQTLGLNVRTLSLEEEATMWQVYKIGSDARPISDDGPLGLIAARGFRARERRIRIECDGPPQLDIRWEVEEL